MCLIPRKLERLQIIRDMSFFHRPSFQDLLSYLISPFYCSGLYQGTLIALVVAIKLAITQYLMFGSLSLSQANTLPTKWAIGGEPCLLYTSPIRSCPL